MKKLTSVLVILCVWFWTHGVFQTLEAKPSAKEKKIVFSIGKNEWVRARFLKNRITVEVKPKRGEGSYQMAKRILKGSARHHKKLIEYNKKQPLKIHKYVPIPFRALNDRMQLNVLQVVFPNDTKGENGWNHRITYPGETLSFIAAIFAIEKISAPRLAKENALRKNGNHIGVGDTVTIPWKWIRKGLGTQHVAVKAPLKLKANKQGKVYASYRLKRGETIYSSVIRRFTGRMIPSEVNRLANKLMSLNGLNNPKKVSAAKDLLIPIEWLSETYVESGHPKAVVASPKKKKAKKKTVARQKSRKKKKFHIILDAGHGGGDPGATAGSIKNGDKVFEDEVVYDIMLRSKKSLEALGFVVHPTTKDPNQSKPMKRLKTKKDDDEVLLVHPLYPLKKNNKIGVNLRVYLANHIYNRLVQKEKVPKENILLISLHGDALGLHDRGTMIYYPDHRFRSKEFRLRSKVYRKHREYTQKIRYYPQENIANANSSKSFGKKIIQTFRRKGIRIHKSSPLRSFYYRKGNETLPAILRYSKIPTSVLVEVANLNNRQDRKLILQSKFRQKLSNALVSSIKDHFHKKSQQRLASR